MKCPRCQNEDTRVYDSRPTEDGRVIRRRRLCERCNFRFTTYERWEEPPLVVIKKDGRRERFDRNKLLNGLLKAVEKRPVSLEALEDIVRDVESRIADRPGREMTTREIGEIVIERLKQLDTVAYVRFASVYRQFTDATDFVHEIERLMREHRRKPAAVRRRK
ncbi:Transcriptional repressor NrdR [bacterium HR11]|nr:Transcriptional repressor NrdR [bacterium HR11]